MNASCAREPDSFWAGPGDWTASCEDEPSDRPPTYAGRSRVIRGSAASSSRNPLRGAADTSRPRPTVPRVLPESMQGAAFVPRVALLPIVGRDRGLVVSHHNARAMRVDKTPTCEWVYNALQQHTTLWGGPRQNGNSGDLHHAHGDVYPDLRKREGLPVMCSESFNNFFTCSSIRRVNSAGAAYERMMTSTTITARSLRLPFELASDHRTMISSIVPSLVEMVS